MAPIHVLISVWNLACVVGLILGFVWPCSGLLQFSIVFGYWANLAAIVTGFVLFLLLVVRLVSERANALLKESWLGFVNAAIVTLFYALLITNRLCGGGACGLERLNIDQCRWQKTISDRASFCAVRVASERKPVVGQSFGAVAETSSMRMVFIHSAAMASRSVIAIPA